MRVTFTLTVLLGAVLLALPTFDGKEDKAIRILPIGDSITQGGHRGQEEYTYRWPLFVLLKEAGINFRFIGTRRRGVQFTAKWPAYKGTPFDPAHEGYYGAKTATVRDNLKKALPRLPPPDFALIHLGTNDQNAKDYMDAVIRPLEETIAILRARNPRVVVLVGHLNFNAGEALKLRPLVEAMAARLNTELSPVVTVHHYQGWKDHPKQGDTDTFDGTHPNPKGQRKMAEKWFAAMKPHLESLSAGKR